MTLLPDPDELDFDPEDDDYVLSEYNADEDRAYIEHFLDRPNRRMNDYYYDYDMDEYPYGFGVD